MTHTITIQTNNPTDLDKIKDLAQSLGLPTIEKHEDNARKSAGKQFLELQKRIPPRQISNSQDINTILDEINV